MRLFSRNSFLRKGVFDGLWGWLRLGPNEIFPAPADKIIDINTQSGKRTALLRIEHSACQYDQPQRDRDTRAHPAALVIGLVSWLFRNRWKFLNFRSPRLVMILYFCLPGRFLSLCRLELKRPQEL